MGQAYVVEEGLNLEVDHGTRVEQAERQPSRAEQAEKRTTT